jgi:repressor LexA
MLPGIYEARSLDTSATATVPLHGQPAGRLTRERIVSAIAAYWSEHGYAPTMREVAAAAGLRSPESVHTHLQQLAAEGRIRYQPETPRSLRVVAQ